MNTILFYFGLFSQYLVDPEDDPQIMEIKFKMIYAKSPEDLAEIKDLVDELDTEKAREIKCWMDKRIQGKGTNFIKQINWN